jgi:RNA polymerase sigma-70 factor (ECF subfamily)
VDRASELFENHHESCIAISCASQASHIAADAAQEAFVRLLERPPKGPVERAWLFKVGTNCVLESRVDLTMADPPRDPAEVLEAEQRRHAVTTALAQLNDKERIAVLMREEGFSHREIADAVGTTTGSVGTLLARVRATGS